MIQRLHCVILMTAGFVVGIPSSVRANLPIFDNALAAGWQNWSWSTTVNFANAIPAYGGSGAAAAVTYTGAWAGLYLHSGSNINTADYTSLRFQIHGGVAGGHAIKVVGYDGAMNQGTSIVLSPTVGGQWTAVDIPLSSFGVAQLSGLVWQDNAGHSQPVYYLDAIELIGGAAAGPPTLSINVLSNRHPISPLIYGLNFADQSLAAELKLPVNRWGGNGTTRYNWQLDTSSHASDWYFENLPNDNPSPGQLPNGSASDDFVDANELGGAESIITVPLIGWTPKARALACGFSVTKYGVQQSVDPWQNDCGNGVRPNGTMITGNDPLDTSIAIGPSFVQSWMAHLIGRYGTAAQGGVRFYNLDNETALWNSTHRDVHPTPVSYDEIRDRTYQYAAAVKAADPTAKTLGPVAWGWSEYFFSALDAAAGGQWWITRPDRMAHGDVPLMDWYLQQMRSYEQTSGVRILDYFDLHYYPQANVALIPAGDAATQARRLRTTRSLWDPTYNDESWIGDVVRLIPRMRDWVTANYPGTKLAMTEYNWGGLEDINGALAQADVLGIFGREQLDLATLWDPPQPSQPGAFAFRVFRNYDGAGAMFGGMSVGATSSDQGQVSIYAADLGDGTLTVVLINKTNGPLTSSVSMSPFVALGSAKVYRYSTASLSQIVHMADLPIPAQPFNVTLPAASITLLAIPVSPAGDLNGDGLVSPLDLSGFVNVLLGIDGDPLHVTRADTNLDGISDGADVAGFVDAILH
jgi:hypothetical protein